MIDGFDQHSLLCTIRLDSIIRSMFWSFQNIYLANAMLYEFDILSNSSKLVKISTLHNISFTKYYATPDNRVGPVSNNYYIWQQINFPASQNCTEWYFFFISKILLLLFVGYFNKWQLEVQFKYKKVFYHLFCHELEP